MKLSRKNLGRVATTFLATAMLASLTAVPAMAAITTPGGMDFTDNSVSFDASIDMTGATGAGMPYGTWIFTLGELTSLPDGHEDSAVLGEVEDVVRSEETATFDAETENYTETVKFDFVENAFDHAGVYYYTVTQTDPEIKGMSADTSTYILKVYVQNVFGEDGALTGYKIANVTMYNQNVAAPGNDDKVGGIENDYATESLKLTKKITGDAANMGETFSFTITLTDPDLLDHATSVTYQVNNGEAQTVSFVNGIATITANEAITNDGYITITGLPVDTDYNIEETDAAAYLTTWEGASITTDTDADDTKAVDGVIADGENAVTVTNNKNAVSPTGIAMDIAPYALLVVIAAAGCFVFLRKRNED